MNPSKIIQLIWDFRGPEAQRTAKHYQKHLSEFLASYEAKSSINRIEVVENQEFWYSCTLEIEETQLPGLKIALKPHRGIYL